jgi:hypothetical protein
VVINGTLVATTNHPFYSAGRWVRADALEYLGGRGSF